MKLFYFRGADGATNFGDELNRYLWPRLLPGVFDRDDGRQFVGIGTLLNDQLPAASRIIVFGSGVGYYGPPQRTERWSIYCVRGPLSAKALGLDHDAAVTDPATLIVRAAAIPNQSTRTPYAFMPHWQSEPDAWKDVCAGAGIGFIDPREEPERVLAAIRSTDVLVTEAMHGAIVADALRIPWVPVRSRPAINTFKWDDWCGSMGLTYRAHELPTIWPALRNAGIIRRARRQAKMMSAARALMRVARHCRPTLSRTKVLHERLDQLEARLEQLRRNECLDRAG
ncbi:MAG TPA: polysaccharide pyruvyl transferase family protein [Vicinamibacterales bacterium]|nr:polysaccharide pyruvyl transferase family protein [Vicinamibacterales bacterium]